MIPSSHCSTCYHCVQSSIRSYIRIINGTDDNHDTNNNPGIFTMPACAYTHSQHTTGFVSYPPYSVDSSNSQLSPVFLKMYPGSASSVNSCMKSTNILQACLNIYGHMWEGYVLCNRYTYVCSVVRHISKPCRELFFLSLGPPARGLTRRQLPTLSI